MSALLAFLHHLAAFTLVSALAVEFVLIRQELTLVSARKLREQFSPSTRARLKARPGFHFSSDCLSLHSSSSLVPVSFCLMG